MAAYMADREVEEYEVSDGVEELLNALVTDDVTHDQVDAILKKSHTIGFFDAVR